MQILGSFYPCAMKRHGLSLIILKKTYQYSLMIIKKLMNQYEVFERELAQCFTGDLQNSKSFSDMKYFADTEKIYKKTKPSDLFFLICKRV